MQTMSRGSLEAAPHIRRRRSTRSIMLEVSGALLPAGLAGVYRFGLRAALVILISVFSAVAAEFCYARWAKRPQSVGDMSAVVTGLLLAYNLPVSVPLWMPAAGAALAIVLVKMLFGGVGCNFVNPALTARAILMTSWPDHMSAAAFGVPLRGVEAVTAATPLTAAYSFGDLLLGRAPGCIGETARLLLLLGGIYLLIRRVITWQIPVTTLLGVFCMNLLFPAEQAAFSAAVREVLSGGLMLGAWFMATDYTTSPRTGPGKCIFGLGCAVMTFVLRRFAAMPGGVSYAILFMNLFTPMIDRFLRPGGRSGKPWRKK